MTNQQEQIPPPDKNIPLSVMVIGTYEIGVALMGLILLVISGGFDIFSIAALILLCVYGAMGAGLWAIQEWARYTNVVLHVIAVPYTLFTTLLLGGQTLTQVLLQILVAIGIIYALTRPGIRHKFQTVVPKSRK